MEQCRNACFMNKDCKGFEFIGATGANLCHIWTTKPKGNGVGTSGNCYIKEESQMTEVKYMKNDDENGMV